jgi:hypothetical protein
MHKCYNIVKSPAATSQTKLLGMPPSDDGRRRDARRPEARGQDGHAAPWHEGRGAKPASEVPMIRRMILGAARCGASQTKSKQRRPMGEGQQTKVHVRRSDECLG